MAVVFPDIIYGSHPNQKVNLYQPDNYDFATETGIDIKGVILWLHGGGWVSGSKDVNKNNYTTYYPNLADQNVLAPLAAIDGLDDDACKAVADLGYLVVSANYRLISNPPDGVFPWFNGGGEFPNNIVDIRELYKYMTFPNYGVGANSSTWELIVRYCQSFGLLIIGGSAGGHLAVAGVFEGAGNSGQWPRGLCNFFGPMDIFPEDNINPVGLTGRSLINSYTSNSSINQKSASPYWKRSGSTDPDGIGYENYMGFSDIADDNKSYNKMKMVFWYNQNDLLVPTTSIEPFINWAQTTLGSKKVRSIKVDLRDTGNASEYRYKGSWNSSISYTGGVGVISDVVYRNGRMFQAMRSVPIGTAPSDPPDNVNWSYGPDSTHNIGTSTTLKDWAEISSEFVFYSGLNFPKFHSRLRPQQGLAYPRTKNTGYNLPPPTYILTASTLSVNEGATAVFNFVTRSVAANQPFTYVASGVSSADITNGVTTSSFNTNSNGEAIISIPIKSDNLSEGPELLIVLIRKGGILGPVVAFASMTVNDTSVSNEILIITPNSLLITQTFTASVSGGVPFSPVTISWTRNGAAFLSTTSTLNSSGGLSLPGNFSLPGSYVLTLTFAPTPDGSGNVRTANLTVNNTNETLTISPTTVFITQTFTSTASGGVPGTSGSVVWTRNGVQVLSGSLPELNNSGTVSIPGNFSQAGNYVLTVTFTASNNVRTASLTVNNTNETLTISPTTVNLSQSFTSTASGGVPGTSGSIVWTRNGSQVLSGNNTLDSNGNLFLSGNFSQSGSYVLTVTFSASGNVRTASLTVNPESVSIPSSLQSYQAFTITIAGGVPNSSFSFWFYRAGVEQFSGTLNLDGSGNYSLSNLSLTVAGSWSAVVTFNTSGNTVSRNIQVTEQVSISPSSVSVNQTFTVTVIGGVPSSNVSVTWYRNGSFLFSGSVTLDSSGNLSLPGSFGQSGTYRLDGSFASGNFISRTVTVN